MIKTLQQALKMDREKFKVPRSVQQAIPIQRIWPDGVFQSGTKFSKTFRFSDINYAIASKEDKTEMFLDYSELLNALDSGAAAKITLNNRRINKEEFEASLLLPMKEDGLDEYRKEYNEMLLSKVSGTNNSIYQERYLTVSVHKKNIDEARTYFARVGTDIITHLSKLSSIGEEMDAEQRLQIFRDFFRADEPQCFPFDMKAFAKKGSSFKDWICPQSMEFSKDCFKINERFGRVLYMQDYASYVKDDMISELCDLSRDLMLSIDILPVPTDEAVREIQNRLLGVETNVTNWQRRQNANNNFSAIVPYDMELQRKETKEMLDDLTTRDQRMMFGILTMVHMADSKKQLDSDTESILSVARKHLCQMATLKWQQVDGLNTVLPYGIRKINALRTLTTESTAVLIPFHTQEIMQPGGIYYGQNAVSKNMLVADRRKLLNGNSFRLGVSGSGKSFSAKEEIVDLALSTEDDILILDPESEFGSLVEALNGEVISISATSHTHLNALDMDSAYGNDKNPLIEKSEFILSLFEQLVGAGNLSAKEKSILDRCTADVYREYIRSGYQSEVPTLKDLYRQLMLQPEEEARGLALSSELFINGSLNTFAQNTPGAIQDADYSIKVGVQYYADCVREAGCESPQDMDKLKLSLQGYNYGNGYISWAIRNHGGYSEANALQFSQEQAAAHGWSGYGDPEYVPHVLRYYSGGGLFAGLFGNGQLVTIAKSQLGNEGGQKFWSWWGFTERQEWCACFVSWCADQAGLIQSGAVPKFSVCTDGKNWFQNQGRWQGAGSMPSPGAIIFFDWEHDGTCDHVGIVERCDGTTVYTIEGNSGDAVKERSYSISSDSIMGYGMVVY